METFLDFRHLDGDRRAREQVERLLACFQQALGHDLPNQLVALQGLARVLEMELTDHLDDESRGHLQRLAALTKRVDESIRALAQVGRWCRVPGPRVLLSVAEVASEAVAEVNLLYPGLAIQYDGLQALPEVAAPRKAVHQVLLQLLRNAARAASGRTLNITVGGRSLDDEVEISVADDGDGIPGDKHPYLIDRFAGTRPTCGLGLFLVGQLVAGWGGAVRIRSEPGKGTAVTVLIPKL